MPYHMYVSNSGSTFLSHFIMDEKTGELAAQPNIELEGEPGAVATNADGSRMFVCLRSTKAFVSYAVDRGSGGLTKIDAATVSEGSPYLYTDNTDRYLLASYYGAGQVSVHAIGDDGSLSDEALQRVDTDTHAHSIQTDASNRFVFVPHTNPANAIFQFRFDETTGALTPNDPPKIELATPEGPRHYVFHPHADFVYSVNENGCTVSAFRFDPDKGTLEAFQVISTLPGDDKPGEGDSTAEIAMTHDGKHLYASNRGPDSLALFDVGDDGSLTASGHFDTEAIPRFFDLDPTGRFLYSAGQASGKLAAYRIDAASGGLERMATYELGKTPLWIQFIEQA